MSYNPDLHHRRSIRLKGFDYAQAGSYFVTFCVKGRECLLGEIENGIMRPSAYGAVVLEVWEKLPTHYPNLQLDAFVVMPNHIHAIFVLVGSGFRPGPTQGKPLTEMVGAFKSFSRKINRMHQTRGRQVWQEDYFERIIHDEDELEAIREYIAQNPLAREEDRENLNR